MKNFKDYVLSEDINTWAITQLSSKYKNGHINWKGLASKEEDKEALIELYKKEHPNWKQEEIDALDINKIKEKVGKVNARKDDLGNLAKTDPEEALRRIKALRLTDETQIQKQQEAIKKGEAYLKTLAASVVTEDDNNLLQDFAKSAHELSELLNGKFNAEKYDITKQTKEAIKELFKECNTSYLKAAADRIKVYAGVEGTNNELTKKEFILGYRNDLEKGNNALKTPGFIGCLKVTLSILILKKATAVENIFTKTGFLDKFVKEEGIEVNTEFFNSLNPINISKQSLADLGLESLKNKNDVKAIIEKINEFVDDVVKEAKNLPNPKEKTEETTAGTKDDTEEQETTAGTEEVSKYKKEGGSSEDSSNNPPSNDDPSGPRPSLNKLNINNSNNENWDIITYYVGDHEGNKGFYLKSFEDEADKFQQLRDEEYKSAVVKESIVLDILNNNPLLTEAGFLRKVKNAIPTVGRINTTSENTERSWNHYKEEAEDLRKSYLSQIEKIWSNYSTRINSVNKKADLLYKIKKLISDYSRTLDVLIIKARKRNSYSEAGKLAHDTRSAFDSAKKGVNKFVSNTAYGQKTEALKKLVSDKVKKITVEMLEQLPESTQPVFGYAVLNGFKCLDEPDVTSTKATEKVKDGVYQALISKQEDFGVGHVTEVPSFLEAFIEEIKNKKDIKSWVEQKAKEYDEAKRSSVIRDEIFALKKFGNGVISKLEKSANPVDDILTSFGLAATDNQSNDMIKDFTEVGNKPLDTTQTQGNINSTQNREKPASVVTEGVTNLLKDGEKLAVAILIVLTIESGYGAKLPAGLSNNKAIFYKTVQAGGRGHEDSVSENDISVAAKNYIKRNDSLIMPSINKFVNILNKKAQPTAQPSVVTSSAVGDGVIPARLYRKELRRKLGKL